MNNLNHQKILNSLYLFFLISFILFGRTFSGIEIFGFRFGEMLIGVGILISISLFFAKKLKNLILIFSPLSYKIHLLILINFVFVAVMNQSSFLNLYTFRSSSYIWTLSFIYIGLYFFNNISTENLFLKIIPFLLIVLYILSTVHFPEKLWDLFYRISDKVDFVKASDLLLAFVSVNFANYILRKNSKFTLSYLLLSSAVFVPFLLFKSKGAFFPAIIFIFASIVLLRKFIKKNILFSLILVILSGPIFVISTYFTYGNLTFTKSGEQFQTESEEASNVFDADNIRKNLDIIVNQKNTSSIFFSFFINDGRLYSTEMMANWRLQIWQDISRDIFWESEYRTDDRGYVYRIQGSPRYDKFYKGFGYNSILPAMDNWERNGFDGTNENPHNFLFYVFGRGGIPQLILFIFYHLSFGLYWYKKNKNFDILVFTIPVLMTSFFDASMESVRFPFVFYSFLALFISLNSKYRSLN